MNPQTVAAKAMIDRLEAVDIIGDAVAQIDEHTYWNGQTQFQYMYSLLIAHFSAPDDGTQNPLVTIHSLNGDDIGVCVTTYDYEHTVISSCNPLEEKNVQA